MISQETFERIQDALEFLVQHDAPSQLRTEILQVCIDIDICMHITHKQTQTDMCSMMRLVSFELKSSRCVHVGLFCLRLGLFCLMLGLLCLILGLFCLILGLFCLILVYNPPGVYTAYIYTRTCTYVSGYRCRYEYACHTQSDTDRHVQHDAPSQLRAEIL